RHCLSRRRWVAGSLGHSVLPFAVRALAAAGTRPFPHEREAGGAEDEAVAGRAHLEVDRTIALARVGDEAQRQLPEQGIDRSGIGQGRRGGGAGRWGGRSRRWGTPRRGAGEVLLVREGGG